MKTMEELLDVLDENGLKTGQVLPRKQVHKEGLWHRVVLIAIIDDENRILPQQRSANKDKNSNKWDFITGGHIGAGQDSVSAAVREINEEVMISLGHNVHVRDFRYMFTYREQERVSENYMDRQYFDFFVLRKREIDISKIIFQESEVQAIDLVDIGELSNRIKSGGFIDRPEVFEVLANYLFRV